MISISNKLSIYLIRVLATLATYWSFSSRFGKDSYAIFLSYLYTELVTRRSRELDSSAFYMALNKLSKEVYSFNILKICGPYSPVEDLIVISNEFISIF